MCSLVIPPGNENGFSMLLCFSGIGFLQRLGDQYRLLLLSGRCYRMFLNGLLTLGVGIGSVCSSPFILSLARSSRRVHLYLVGKYVSLQCRNYFIDGRCNTFRLTWNFLSPYSILSPTTN